MTDSDEPDLDQSPDLPFDIAQAALDRQLGSIDAVDAKTGAIFAAGGTSYALLAAVLALRPKRFDDAGILAMFIVSGILYLVIAILSVLTLRSRTYKTGPRAGEVINKYEQGASEHAAKWGAARGLIEAIADNASILTAKSRRLTWCAWLLAIETAAVIVGLILTAD